MRPASLLTLSLIPQATEGSVVNKAQISPAISQRETLRHCWPRPVGPHPCPAVTLPLVPVSPAPVPQREAEGISTSLISPVGGLNPVLGQILKQASRALTNLRGPAPSHGPRASSPRVLSVEPQVPFSIE